MNQLSQIPASREISPSIPDGCSSRVRYRTLVNLSRHLSPLFAPTSITIRDMCPFRFRNATTQHHQHQNATTQDHQHQYFDCSCPYFRNEIGGEVEKQIALTRDTGKNWGMADDGSERSRQPCHTPRQVCVLNPPCSPFLLSLFCRPEASACWSTRPPTGSLGSALMAASRRSPSSRGRTPAPPTSATSSTGRSTRTGSGSTRRWDQWRFP